jgi:hypothetical protein
MGSSASAHTYVETEVPNFKPGDRVSGVIKIYVEEPVSATYLHLVLIGKEKTRWTEERRRRSILSNRNEYYTATLKGEKKFLELSFPIWNFGDHLDKGQYTIPFSLKLPDWLFPSFLFKNRNLKGEILYKLKSVFHDTERIKSHKNVILVKSLLNPNHP